MTACIGLVLESVNVTTSPCAFEVFPQQQSRESIGIDDTVVIVEIRHVKKKRTRTTERRLKPAQLDVLLCFDEGNAHIHDTSRELTDPPSPLPYPDLLTY